MQVDFTKQNISALLFILYNHGLDRTLVKGERKDFIESQIDDIKNNVTAVLTDAMVDEHVDEMLDEIEESDEE